MVNSKYPTPSGELSENFSHFPANAIVATSANPFHFGHLYLYEEALKIFGVDHLKIAIGRNSAKNMDFNRIIFHLTPYGIDYDAVDGITLADYCRSNKIHYVVRGIRNATDLNYELVLNSMNREKCDNLRTIFFPSSPSTDGISSHSIQKLLNCGDFNAVKNCMNEDAMYRFYHGMPRYLIFFVEEDSLTGEARNYLKNIYGKNLAEIEYIKNIIDINGNTNGNDSGDNFWEELFFSMENKLLRDEYFIGNQDKFSNFSRRIKNRISFSKPLFPLFFPHMKNHWYAMTPEIRGKFYLIKIKTKLKTKNKNSNITNIKHESSTPVNSKLTDFYSGEVPYYDELWVME